MKKRILPFAVTAARAVPRRAVFGRNLYHELKRMGKGSSKCYEGAFDTWMSQIQWYENNGEHFQY